MSEKQRNMVLQNVLVDTPVPLPSPPRSSLPSRCSSPCVSVSRPHFLAASHAGPTPPPGRTRWSIPVRKYPIRFTATQDTVNDTQDAPGSLVASRSSPIRILGTFSGAGRKEPCLCFRPSAAPLRSHAPGPVLLESALPSAINHTF